MNTKKELISMAMTMADHISELDSLLEKVDVLTDELLTDYIEKMDLRSEVGVFAAKYNFRAARIKGDMIRRFITPATELSEMLTQDSGELLQAIKNLGTDSE